MASGIFNKFRSDIINKAVNLATDDIRIALMTNIPFNATYIYWSDYTATGNEVVGTGYLANGTSLTNKTATYSTVTAKWDADDTAWTTASFSAYFATIYDVTNSNQLICCFDFGGVKTVSAGTFTLQYSASGIITLT
jgi:hypothetical protein